jgi:hypothetical protein
MDRSFKVQVPTFKTNLKTEPIRALEFRRKSKIENCKSKMISFLIKLPLNEGFEFGNGLGGIIATNVQGQFAAGTGGEHH